MPPKTRIGFAFGMKPWSYSPYCNGYDRIIASGKDTFSGNGKNTMKNIELHIKENRLFNRSKKRIRQIQRLLRKSVYK